MHMQGTRCSEFKVSGKGKGLVFRVKGLGLMI